MLSRLPGRLASPFALFGDDAKLAFRTQPGGILRLAQARTISETDSYWDQYLVLFDSPSDVFALISPHDIRRALVDAPENVATLVRVICSRLFNLVSAHNFPSPPPSAVSSLTASFIKSTGGAAERNTTKEVLNCLRVLQRVLPVVFESETEMNAFEKEVLWKREEAPDDDAPPPGQTDTEEPQFVIEDEDDDDDDGARARSPKPESPRSPTSTKEKKTKTLPSLAERLFSCTMDLLFCCGFTLPLKIQVDHYKINYVIWEKGVGAPSAPDPTTPTSPAIDANRTEVLRLLLVLLSRQIYIPPTPSAFFTRPTSYTLHLVQRTPRRDVLTLLCSLLNTVLQLPSDGSGTSMMSVGGRVAGKLPYNHLVFKGDDPRASLVGVCFQLLCVLLDYQSGSARDKETVGPNGEVTSAPTAHTNAFRYFVAKLHRPADFEFVLAGVLTILEAQMATFNGLLPGARRAIPHIPETYIFFWKMIELNKKFRAFVLASDRANDVLAYVLGYALEIKDKPQQHGLSRALSYIVQTLSAEPAFGQRLSSPMTTPAAAKWASGGTAGDFLIFSIYAMVATTSGTLTSLYPALIIALSNCAPFFRNLGVTASQRLIGLFKAFANPLFLLGDEGHPRLLYFMLETFNGVLTHNLAGNPNLVYVILREHVAFEDLGTFTLAKGLREVRRVQLAKEELARKAAQRKKGKAAVARAGDRDGEMEGADDVSPKQEKAPLLENEEGTGLGLSLADSVEQLPAVGSPGVGAGVNVETPPVSPPPPSVLPLETTATTPVGEVPPSISEKARGKMKAGAESRSTSFDSVSSYDRVAAAGVGRNGFVPTQEWVSSWQQGLPLDIVMLTISELLPRLREIQGGSGASRSSASNAAVVDFLGSTNLAHVLPPAQPFLPRRFMWSDASIIWLTSLIWGEIYVRAMVPLGIWNGTNVRLFYVKHTQQGYGPGQGRHITVTDAVSTVVGGFWGRGGSAAGPGDGGNGNGGIGGIGQGPGTPGTPRG